MKVKETSLPYTAAKPKLTYRDYAQLPDDGNRYELINGELIIVAAPLTIHQKVNANISSQLIAFVEKNKLGQVFYAPIDVVLSSHNTLQPDIIFIEKKRKTIITEKNINGAPDLVIEILSPSSFYYDLFDKKELYEQHGVKEYWLVDPLRQWADLYVLKGKSFELVQHREKEGALHSSVLNGFTIDLPQMFAFDI